MVEVLATADGFWVDGTADGFADCDGFWVVGKSVDSLIDVLATVDGF